MAAMMVKSDAQPPKKGPRRNSISPPPTMSPLRVVLLGNTGSGKSASANTILGRKAFKEDFLRKICSNQRTEVDGRQITVIDTLGWFDREMHTEELKGELEKCVEMSLPGPHAFLLVIRLGVRYTEEERNVVQWIQENFGEGALKYTIVLLTHGDVLEGNSVEDYLRKSPALSSLIECVGGKYQVFNNKSKDSTQVRELTKKIEAMVKENGGTIYTSEIFKEVQGKRKEKEEREREEEEKGKAEEETRKKELEMERRKRRDAEMKANEEKKRADEAMKRADKEGKRADDEMKRADKEGKRADDEMKKAWEETEKKKQAEREQKNKEDEVRCMKKIVEMSVGTAVGIGGLGVVAATVGGVVAAASGGGETAAAAAAAAVGGAVAAVAAGAAAAAAAAAVGGAIAAVAAGGGAAAAVAAAAVGAAGGGVIAVAAALAGAATATAGGAAALVAAAVAGAVVGAAAVAIGRQIC